MACLLPQASKGPFEERALAGQGQPSIASPKAPPSVKRWFSSGTRRASPASLPERAVLVRPGPRQLCAFFSFCRQVEISRARAEQHAAAVPVKSRWKERNLREAGALRGGVLRRAEAADGVSGMPSEGLAPSRAYRPLRAPAGPTNGAAASAGTVRRASRDGLKSRGRVGLRQIGHSALVARAVVMQPRQNVC